MNITIVGTGYVGLVTGTCFAETGNHVLCVDIDEKKVKSMQAGEVPIYEPGLENLFERNTKAGRLKFTTDLNEGAQHGEIVFLALPTPPDEDGSADLSYILGVAEQLGQLIQDYTVLVDKSTVPVGTSVKVYAKLAMHLDPALFDVVSNPEFLREGVAVEDFMRPDRVVIGTSSEKAARIMHKLYEPFVRQGNPIITMDERSAEMTKYAANSYLATRITFMNEIANLCEKVGANVDQVRMGMGSDARIGKRFLFPGIGYGGSCFPKDVQALAKTAQENAYDFQILQSVMGVNDVQKSKLVEKIKSYFGDELKNKKIALWGLAFKAETDDIREASSIRTIQGLLNEGTKLKVFDPEAMDNIRQLFGDQIEYASDQYDTLIGADALAVATEWSVFRAPSYNVIKELLTEPVIFDGRNLYNLETMQKEGIHYESIGRSIIN